MQHKSMCRANQICWEHFNFIGYTWLEHIIQAHRLRRQHCRVTCRLFKLNTHKIMVWVSPFHLITPPNAVRMLEHKRSFVPQKICNFYEKYVNWSWRWNIITLWALFEDCGLNEPTLYSSNVLGNPEREDEIMQWRLHMLWFKGFSFSQQRSPRAAANKRSLNGGQTWMPACCWGSCALLKNADWKLPNKAPWQPDTNIFSVVLTIEEIIKNKDKHLFPP